MSLTFHKYSEQLRCHYCGYTSVMPRECSSCHSSFLEMRGAGTERIEDDLKAIFPDAKLLRMDYDTAKSKTAYENIIETFEQGKADILIGTQMVTKGLDFKDVQLVGVLSADALLYYPDFRAMERAYQLLSQVSGRAGRSKEASKVLIQIGNPSHPIVSMLQKDTIEPFYNRELIERKKFQYPPFVRMIHITITEPTEQIAQQAAKFLYQQLQPQVIGECLGPSIPSIARLRNRYIREVLIKMDRDIKQINRVKHLIFEVRQLMYQYDMYKKVRLTINVDP
ncbi:MAG TPA: primosomal protein N', partial [Chitinophagales bacterium]|nr:primosomal protein N' [Chitinophagales bacterium]